MREAIAAELLQEQSSGTDDESANEEESDNGNDHAVIHRVVLLSCSPDTWLLEWARFLAARSP